MLKGKVRRRDLKHGGRTLYKATQALRQSAA